MKRELDKIRTLNPDIFLDYYTEVIDEELEIYWSRVAKKLGNYHPVINEAYEGIGEFLRRKGKRIASCTMLLTYHGYANQVDEAILNVCLASELYRHSILVHDDLVDKDDFRRNGPTFHRLFTDKYDERFGEGVAIFFGNILLSEAFTRSLKTGFETTRLLKAVESFSTGYREVNESQVLDLLFENKDPSLKEWEAMTSKRAASLFNVNMVTGALLGGADEEELQLIAEGARHIGFSFDIQDDIIGTFASEEQCGRPTGGDIILGKKPLHVVYAYQLAEEKDRDALRRFLTSKKLNPKGIERVKEIVRRCGALEKAKQKSKDHAKTAVETLNKTSMNTYSKDVFVHLINFVSDSLNWYQ